MKRGLVIRQAEPGDAEAIHELLIAAFDGPAEAGLVEQLRIDGDAVLELVATLDGSLVGEVFFSRLTVDSGDGGVFDAVALAPLAVAADMRRTGVGRALVENAHHVLAEAGEKLALVLGDPAYYSRFGYLRERAERFDSDYQGEYLQALWWGEAPATGRLVYAAAFSRL